MLNAWHELRFEYVWGKLLKASGLCSNAYRSRWRLTTVCRSKINLSYEVQHVTTVHSDARRMEINVPRILA